MTTLSLGTVHHLSSATVIESLLFFLRIIPLKKSQGGAENRTRAAWARSLNATAVLWRPPSLTILWVWLDLLE